MDELEVEIEKLVESGVGLARFQGVPVFVKRSAPGDRLRVRITKRHPDYGTAEILEILEPGPSRRTPPCRYFDRCGGCELQHLNDAAQLELKVAAAKETLLRLGRVEVPAELRVLSGPAWGYRQRVQLHVAVADGDSAQVGYFATKSHDLVSVDRCPVLVKDLEDTLSQLPSLLKGSSHRRLDLAAVAGRVVCSPPVPGVATGELELTVGPSTYSFDARCFVQGHQQLLEPLIDEVLSPWPPVAPAADSLAVDLYAGIGFFSVALAQRFSRVVAVESDPVACRYARKNFRRNAVRGGEVVHLAVEQWMKHLPSEADVVIVDPPRAGLPARVREALLAAGPPWITYVSCQPATLARDLAQLSRRYQLRSLAFADLFPQTGHIESIAHLGRRGRPPATD